MASYQLATDINSGNTHVKFKKIIAQSDFQCVFKERIEYYFNVNNISKKGNFKVYLKIIFGILAWVFSYVALLKFGNTPGLLIVCFTIHGFTHVFIGLNIAHDACHGSLFNKKTWNNCAAWIFDLVGMSSFKWKYTHNRMHHPFTNVIGKDPYIVPTKWLRFSMFLRWRKMHAYQHLYVFILYGFTTVFWCITSDIAFFFSKKERELYKISFKTVLWFVLLKLFYLIYCVVIPITVLHVAWYYIVIGFALLHFVNGIIISFVLQSGHIQETLLTSEVRQVNLADNFFEHTLKSTMDHGYNNPVYSWLMGNINLHTVHHLYPGVCHIHYKRLTEILQKTAADFNISYNGNATPVQAFRLHLTNLKILSKQ